MNNRYMAAGLFLAGLLSACSLSGSKPLSIAFNADSTAIVFRHIDQAGLLQLKQAAPADSVLANLIAVLQTPSESDTTVMEEPVTGQFELTDSTIIFKPSKPFVRNRDYLVITHLNSKFGDAGQIISGQLSPQVKPLQQLLSR